MKITKFLFTAVAVLSLGAGSILAQNLTPGSAVPASYYATNTPAGTSDSYLEYRMDMLEEALKKKVDKVDTTKAFEVKLSGRLFLESVTFADPHVKYGDFAGQENALGAREVFVGMTGTGYRIFDYSVELGFAGNHSAFRDAFIGIKNVPGLDYFRIGYYRVETGVGMVTSPLNTTAIDTPTASQAFTLGRRFGVGQTYYFANEQVRWFNGIFESTGVSAGPKIISDPQGMIYNSRLTFVPYYAQDGKRFLHFGGHYMYRERPKGGDDFTAPGARIGGFSSANAWFATTALNASSYNQGGLEVMWGCGPLAITSEFFAGSFGEGRDMYGGYVEARYFLTGDVRLYNKRSGTPGGVRLKQNFLCVEEFIQTCHGKAKGFGIQSIGAWEVYTQWGFTDSDRVARAAPRVIDGVVDASHSGGRTTDLVFGLNWYLNPTTRMMFEYVRSEGAKQGTGGYRATEDIFATSFRINF